MCERRDAAAAVIREAAHLTEVCEAVLHGPSAHRGRANAAGIGRAVRDSFSKMSVTPADMALQLRKLDK